MNELDTFYTNKNTLNKGYIFFDNYKQALEFIKILEQMHIRYMKYVIQSENHKYFGFKLWGFRKRFFELCVLLKEVLTK